MTWWALDVRTAPASHDAVASWLVSKTGQAVEERDDGMVIGFAPSEEAARTHNLTLIKDRCIIEEHRHLAGATGEPTAGHPLKQGVHVQRRRRRSEENHVTIPGSGYVEGGGGGHKAGGGKHSVLDEKKMISGRRRHR